MRYTISLRLCRVRYAPTEINFDSVWNFMRRNAPCCLVRSWRDTAYTSALDLGRSQGFSP